MCSASSFLFYCIVFDCVAILWIIQAVTYWWTFGFFQSSVMPQWIILCMSHFLFMSDPIWGKFLDMGLLGWRVITYIIVLYLANISAMGVVPFWLWRSFCWPFALYPSPFPVFHCLPLPFLLWEKHKPLTCVALVIQVPITHSQRQS